MWSRETIEETQSKGFKEKREDEIERKGRGWNQEDSVGITEEAIKLP